jgi:putative ABC transport system permease protein
MVILGIFNTMNMSVMERVGEIGTMMALGTTRTWVLKMFIAEGAVLGAVGGLLGTAVGAGLAMVISYIGIPMPLPPGTTLPWTAEISVDPGHLIFGFFLALGSSVVSSAFPAFKAARLEIAAALRRNIGV